MDGDDLRALRSALADTLGRSYTRADLRRDLAELGHAVSYQHLTDVERGGLDLGPALAASCTRLGAYIVATGTAPTDPPEEGPGLPPRLL